MKKSILSVLVALFAGMVAYGQSTEVHSIEQTIYQFVAAGDNSDAEDMSSYLDENYRIVMNQMFGSEGVVLVDREIYLLKIRSKEWGGNKRTVGIESITINGNTASAVVKLQGSTMNVRSTFEFIQNREGRWLLIGDTPVII